jgi:hypothetical protein
MLVGAPGSHCSLIHVEVGGYGLSFVGFEGAQSRPCLNQKKGLSYPIPEMRFF